MQAGLELGALDSGPTAPSPVHFPTTDRVGGSLGFGPSCGASKTSGDRGDGQGAGSPGLWLHRLSPEAAPGAQLVSLSDTMAACYRASGQAGHIPYAISCKSHNHLVGCPPFDQWETEAQRGKAACLRFHRGKVAGLA